MDTEISARMDAQEQKINEILEVVKKTRKHMLIGMWVTILTILLPILGLIFAVPIFMNSYIGSLKGLI